MEYYYTGAIIETKDKRDFKYEELGSSSVVDWEKGFIVPLPKTKDQQNTSACGGFATASFMEVLSTIHDKKYDEKSPKFIYSLAKPAGSGGSAKTQLAKTLRDFGSADEATCKSFLPDGTTNETFISNRGDITQEAFDNAKKDKSSGYLTLDKITFDKIAEMIQKYNGCIIGIYGENNGTWRTAYPRSTKGFRIDQWRHWIYGVGFKLINGKKHIGILNSWGDVGENGVQWLNEEHIKDIWDVWTFSYNLMEEYKFTQTLRFGMRNSHVGMLQKKLKELGYFPKEQSITSYFGTITVSAVRKFQKDNGLVADSIVGKKTNEKLNK